MMFWFFLHRGPKKVQTGLHICMGFPEPLLLPYKYLEVDEEADKKLHF